MQYGEKDYLMRLLNRFFDFLNKILNKNMDSEMSVQIELDNAYSKFFNANRDCFLGMEDSELIQYAKEEISKDQIRPLALLLYHDARIEQENDMKINLFKKSKLLLLISQEITGILDLNDNVLLAKIDDQISSSFE